MDRGFTLWCLRTKLVYLSGQMFGIIFFLQNPQLLNEIKAVATSHESFLISKESTPQLFEFYAKNIFSLPVNIAVSLLSDNSTFPSFIFMTIYLNFQNRHQ